jgi:dipeptidyl-peptidase-4
MGYPVEQSYEESSNVANAWRLSSSPMLSGAELDTNVDAASTMQVVPDEGHGVATSNAYAAQRTHDFLYRKLKVVEPPK